MSVVSPSGAQRARDLSLFFVRVRGLSRHASMKEKQQQILRFAQDDIVRLEIARCHSLFS